MPEQYYDLTIGEIIRHYKGYQIRESKQWERARFIAWYGSLPYQKKNSHTEPEDIMKLPTDPTAEEKDIMRKERERETMEAYQKVIESYRQMGFEV